MRLGKGKEEITINGTDNTGGNKKDNSGKGCGIGCLAVIIIFIVICVIITAIMPDDDDSSSKSSKASKTASVKTISAAYKKVSNHKPTHVEYYKDSGFALVEYKDKEDTWNETEFVRKHTTRYINLCRKAYKLKGLKNITYTVSTKMQDQKGNSSYDDVLSIEMKKPVFNTYHWSKLVGDQDSIQSAIDNKDFDKFYVAPGIEENVNWNKVYYDGSDVYE